MFDLKWCGLYTNQFDGLQVHYYHSVNYSPVLVSWDQQSFLLLSVSNRTREGHAEGYKMYFPLANGNYMTVQCYTEHFNTLFISVRLIKHMLFPCGSMCYFQI